MALRPTWRGHLRLALVSCPVRLTPATTSSSNIRFHKLNRKTGNRLKQQMIDSETGKTVERDETIMGYEFEKGKYVKVEPEEIDALKIESSEIITIERIVKAADVDLLFQERGYWLFLTGHRQGDLRRLVRVYGRDPERVYPTGRYPGAFNIYGTDVTAPIPGAERLSNPLFTGCRSRGA